MRMRQAIKAGSRPPWMGLAAAVWVQFGAGSGYTFPLYSSTLKSVMGFNQQQLTVLGVANDIGENVGILPGIACNKFPPWVVLSCGVLCCFLGYGVIWLAVSETVLDLPYWLIRSIGLTRFRGDLGIKRITWCVYQLFLALVVATNSNAWFGTAILVTNMRNFPYSRGTVAGILKGYSGISAAIFTEIFSLVLKNSASKLLAFLTVGIPAICLAMMYLIRPCTPASGEDSAEHGHFLFTQGMSIFLGVYLLTTTILGNAFSLSSALCYTLVAIMVVLMLSPLAIPIKMTLFPSASKRSQGPVDSSEQLSVEVDEGGQTQPLITPSSSEQYLGNGNEEDYSSDAQTLLALGEGAVKKKKRPRRGDDFGFREALVKADFWLLWMVYFVGVGTGVTVLNNLAQIGYAQGVDDTTILLSLFSFGNFLGRLSGGAVSEHFVRSIALPRTVWMIVTQLIMLLTFVLYASALSGTLYPATLFLGTAYGVQFAIMIPTVSELFGLKNFGIFYNFMQIGNPVGALLFSGWLAGYVYDVEAAKQGGSSCTGASCFRLTFLILAGVCGLGSLLGVVLTLRIRPVYKMLYAGGSFRLPPTEPAH